MTEFYTRTEDEPHDRMTRIGDAMLEAMRSHPEREHDTFAIVMLDDDVTREAAIITHGYEDEMHAVRDVIVHLRAMLRSMGKEMAVFSMPKPIGRDE